MCGLVSITRQDVKSNAREGLRSLPVRTTPVLPERCYFKRARAEQFAIPGISLYG